MHGNDIEAFMQFLPYLLIPVSFQFLIVFSGFWCGSRERREARGWLRRFCS